MFGRARAPACGHARATTSGVEASDLGVRSWDLRLTISAATPGHWRSIGTQAASQRWLARFVRHCAARRGLLGNLHNERLCFPAAWHKAHRAVPIIVRDPKPEIFLSAEPESVNNPFESPRDRKAESLGPPLRCRTERIRSNTFLKDKALQAASHTVKVRELHAVGPLIIMLSCPDNLITAGFSGNRARSQAIAGRKQR